MNIIDQTELTAFHEIGHAAVGCTLGAKIEYVTIIPSGHNRGLCMYRPPVCAADRVAGHLAGAHARQKRQGRPWPVVFDEGDLGDLEAIDGFLQQVWSIQTGKPASQCPDPRAHAHYQSAIELAQTLVDDLWPTITHLAYLLLERRTIRGKLIHQIVNEFSGASHV